MTNTEKYEYFWEQVVPLLLKRLKQVSVCRSGSIIYGNFPGKQLCATGVAPELVATQGGRAAELQVGYGASVRRQQRRAMLCQIRRPEAAEYVSHFEHGGPAQLRGLPLSR